MTPESIAIDAIIFDSETQPRAAILQDMVTEYREAIEDGAAMPPVTLFFDGQRYWIADGFHRVLGFRAAGFTEVDAEVHPGGKREAILHAVGANADHGMRRTNADKRRAVEIVLRDAEWREWSDGVIGDRCHVHPSTVANIRKEMYPTSENRKTKRKGKDGRTRDTSKCGKSNRNGKATAPATAPPAAKPSPVATVEPDEEPETDLTPSRDTINTMFGRSDFAEALAALLEIQQRYSHVEELSNVFAEIDRLHSAVAS